MTNNDLVRILLNKDVIVSYIFIVIYLIYLHAGIEAKNQPVSLRVRWAAV